MSVFRSISSAARSVCLVAATASLAGCGLSTKQIISTFANIPVSGNWQISSTSPLAGDLPAFSGAFSGTGAAFTGVMHSNWGGSCISPSTSFVVKGATNSNGLVTITNDNILGGILSISGNLASDGKSITNASYTISGGNCSFDADAPAIAAEYAPLSGTYTGTFSDADGPVINVTATLNQSQPDSTTGNYTLTGSGTFNANPCFNSPVPMTDTMVTGGNFTFTYTDPTTMNNVQVTGTFPPDGTVLTVTNWTLTHTGSGSATDCGTESGTGSLTPAP